MVIRVPQHSSMDTTCDETVFLNKFIVFRQDYIKLHKLYADIVEEKKLLQTKLQILESRLKLEECDSASSKIIRQQQEEIIQLLKKKDNYNNLKNANEVLQQKIQFLESKLKSDRSLYEQEIQRVLDNTENRVEEIKKYANNEAEEKILFMEQKCRELSVENEELNQLLETIRRESRNEIDQRNVQYQQEMNKIRESKIVLERENKMLIDKLLQQEECFNLELKVLKEEKKEYYENLKLITRRNTSLQTLNEAFSNKEQCIASSNSRRASDVSIEKRTHLPFVTDEKIFVSKK